MSKKDYILLASVLAKYNKAMQGIDYKITGNTFMFELTGAIARVLAEDNNKFDVVKFLKASGLKE